jgi:hypothetical protein
MASLPESVQIALELLAKENSRLPTWIAPAAMSAIGLPPPFAGNQCYDEGNGIGKGYHAIIPCPEEPVNAAL